MSYNKVNIVLFGTGNVGKTFIEQLKKAADFIENSCGIKLALIGIANTKKFWFHENNIIKFENEAIVLENYTLEEVVTLTKDIHPETLIAVDATASEKISGAYEYLVKNGFNIVAANKIANTNNQANYVRLREVLKQHSKMFKYETNVGAGLPVIETVRALYECGDQVTKIRGVFSGSLSYIFNTFCERAVPFSDIVREALKLGYTEPDPRIDLSGKDVARKLLILARELGLLLEFEDIKIKSLLIPNLHESTSLNWFLRNMTALDTPFETAKTTLKPGSVLRYIGELEVAKRTLEVKLISEPQHTPLGQLKGTDSIFEIYTKSYDKDPLVIKGAGAGKEVTARGVLSDVLKISKALVSLKTVNIV
jgi:homoserine dehydrogenase